MCAYCEGHWVRVEGQARPSSNVHARAQESRACTAPTLLETVKGSAWSYARGGVEAARQEVMAILEQEH